MSYSVIFSKNAKKQLDSLDLAVRERITLTLERIRIRPKRYVQKLAGRPHYRLKIGDYRVIMDIQNDDLLILVIKIGHRKNVYDDL